MSDPFRAQSPTEWERKLVGKKIVDDKDATATSSSDFVKRSELPEVHRVISPGSIVTKDYRPERLNVHVDDNGKCTHCMFG